MHNYNFTSKMNGLWISQSTNYSELQNHNKILNTFINKIKWTNISIDAKFFSHIRQKLKEEYSKEIISLSQVKFFSTRLEYKLFYVLFSQDKLNNLHLTKFDENLQVINKFSIQIFDSQNICLTSEINSFTLIEKIYFLNEKVKLIKSVIKKRQKYIATYFSSEIKIS